MTRTPLKRRITSWLILCILALQGMNWTLGMVRDLRLFSTEAASTAIQVPTPVEVCPHHPQGCPKECLCPKMNASLDEEESDALRPGAVRETKWVACTEQGPRILPLSLPAFLTGDPLTLPLTAGEARSTTSGGINTILRSRDPLEKIPI